MLLIKLYSRSKDYPVFSIGFLFIVYYLQEGGKWVLNFAECNCIRESERNYYEMV